MECQSSLLSESSTLKPDMPSTEGERERETEIVREPPSMIPCPQHANNSVIMCCYILLDEEKKGGKGHLSLVLQFARFDNGGFLAVFDLAGIAAGGFNGFHNLERLLVCDFAEDNVLAVEPAGDDSGNEELGSIAGGEEG